MPAKRFRRAENTPRRSLRKTTRATTFQIGCPEGEIAASWRWASVVNSPFVSGEVKTMNLRPFPIGPFSDYTALRAAVVAGAFSPKAHVGRTSTAPT